MSTIKVESTEKSAPTPAGTHWGAFVSDNVGTGRWLIRDSDGASVEVYAEPGYPVTAEELDVNSVFEVPA